jgi:WD40 repeat protein
MQQKITTQNAQHLSQRICLGRGRKLGAVWLDNTTLSVCTTLGMWNYHTDGHEEHIGTFADNHVHSHVIAYNPDKKSIACVGGENLSYTYVLDIATWQKKFAVHHSPDNAWGLLDIAFSPDGNILAGLSVRRTYLWDAHTGKLIHHWQAENGAFCKVMFTPDSKTLIVAGDFIGTWDVASGHQIHKFLLSKNILYSGSVLSDDGTKIARTKWNTVSVWDVPTEKQILELAIKNTASLAFHPANKILAIRDSENIKLYDFEQQRATTLPDGEHRNGGLAFNSEGSVLASGSFDDTLRLWDVKLGTQITALANTAYKLIDFNPEGTVLACTKRDETLYLVNIANHQQSIFQQGHSSPVYPIVINTQDLTITSASDDHSARLWNMTTEQHHKSAHVWGGDAPFFEFNPDGTLLLSSDSDNYHHGAMWVQNLETGERLLTKAEGNPVRFSVDGKWIIYHSQQLFALNIQTQEIRPFFAFNFGEYGRLSPDCRYMELHRRDQSIDVVEVDTGKICVELGGSVQRFEFSSDSNYFMTVNDLEGEQGSYITVLRKTATGEKILDYRDVYRGHLLSPDAKSLILTHSHNYSPKILDMISKNVVATLPIKGTYTFAFSPDSSLFVSGAYLDDSGVKVWQTDTCECLATLEGHRSHVTNIKFSDDQTLLVSAGRDGTIRVWDLSKLSK